MDETEPKRVAESQFSSKSSPQRAQFMRRQLVACLTLIASHWLAKFAVAESPVPVFADPPRLATTQAALAAEKAREDFASKRLVAVEEGGCPARPGRALAGGPRFVDLLLCLPRRRQQERTIAAYRCQMHHDLEHAALQFGWAYAYTDNDQYAAAARRILMHLADAYAEYPSRRDRWGRRGWLAPLGGRRYVQSLDEAVGVIRLAKAYDLTRRSPVWQRDERTHVEDDFFRATAATLLRFNQGINNHQTWYNAGLMAIASVLADEGLVPTRAEHAWRSTMSNLRARYRSTGWHMPQLHRFSRWFSANPRRSTNLVRGRDISIWSMPESGRQDTASKWDFSCRQAATAIVADRR